MGNVWRSCELELDFVFKNVLPLKLIQNDEDETAGAVVALEHDRDEWHQEITKFLHNFVGLEWAEVVVVAELHHCQGRWEGFCQVPRARHH